MKKTLFIALLFIVTWVNGQELSNNDQETYNKAYGLFMNDSFSDAKPLFETVLKANPNHYKSNYYLGNCYLNTRYSKSKAIPYLTKALELGKTSVPIMVHINLGDLFHLNYEFRKSIYHFNLYLRKAPKGDVYIDHARRMLKTCINAKYLMSDTLNVNIENLGAPVNTKNSEFAPYVSADDSILFFTFKKFYTDEELVTNENPDTLSRLYVSSKEQGTWTAPKAIKISGLKTQSNVSIAGLSPDGEFIYINAMNNDHQDIYMGRYLNDGNLDLQPLPEPINSPYWEGKVSLSAQGDFLWFSSNRPGGIGGKDIYKCERKEGGGWGEPINVGEAINTRYDEDAPFLHPSGNIFYFSSNGHKSIGGYDILSILLSENQVFKAENMGFPINTTSDDMYFALSGSGESGYFSSAYGNKYGNHDIYRIEMDMNIPLTIVKGTILAGNPAKPVGAKIRVLDLKTGEKLKYVYNPNPKTGRYLLILPPNNDYTMIIESEDFFPQRIILQIPEQKNFFELFQSIRLMPVMSLGQQVGEQVEVNNSFMQAAMDAEAAGEVGEAGVTDDGIDYAALFHIVDQIITATDTLNNEVLELRGLEENNINTEVINELFVLIDEAFEEGDTEALNKIQEETIVPDKFQQVFLYSENMESSELSKVIVGNDTIYTSPEMLTFNEHAFEKTKRNDLIGIKEEARVDSSALLVPKKRQFTATELRRSKEEDRRNIITHTIYFNVDSYQCDAKSKEELKEISELIINNDNLGFSVLGYTDMTGDASYNKKLSQKRSFNIVETLEGYGVDTQRAIIRGLGEAKSTNRIYKNDRRVDVTVFELIIE